MKEDIPADIMEAAGAAILRGGKAYEVGGKLHLSIASALQDERGYNIRTSNTIRCARIDTGTR